MQNTIWTLEMDTNPKDKAIFLSFLGISTVKDSDAEWGEMEWG